MAGTATTYMRSLTKGLLLAAVIGLVVAGGCESLAAYATERPPSDVLDTYTLAEAGLIASPFAVLAILHIDQAKCWVVGLLVTCAYWGLMYLPSAMQVGGGANIGWALTVAFMPLVTLVASMLALLPEAAALDAADRR